MAMLDWPEKSQTSPMRTSWRAVVWVPEVRVRVCGVADAGRGSRLMRPWPLVSDLVVAEREPRAILISALGSAVPQMGSGRPRWRTMWSPKTEAGARAAGEGVAIDRAIA